MTEAATTLTIRNYPSKVRFRRTPAVPHIRPILGEYYRKRLEEALGARSSADWA